LFFDKEQEMAKVVTMHQPNYLPWIGFFSKVKKADCLILYDDAQYIKGGPINRNKIRTPDGFTYLTVPVGHKAEGLKICEVTLPAERSWQRSHWKQIHDVYAKTAFFDNYKSFFEKLYQKEYEHLWKINEEIIIFLLKCFDIEVEIIKASKQNIDPDLKKTDRMIALLKSAGATVYLSGPSGKDYLEFEKFSRNNLALDFATFQHPVYPQRFTGFEPNLAAIDLLFNMGPQSIELIGTSGNTEKYEPIMSLQTVPKVTKEMVLLSGK
jgi:hypothetical protein